MKKLIAAMAVVITVCMSFSFKANAETVFACDLKCSNMYTKARKSSIIFNDGEVFSVIDTKTAAIKSYRAVKHFDAMGVIIETAAEIQTTTTANSTQNFFIQHRQSRGVFNITVPVSDNNVGFSDVTSSSQLILYPQNQDWIALFLEANASLQQQIEASIAELSSRISLGFDFSMSNRIVVQFSDKSTAEFTTVSSLKNGTLFVEVLYLDGSARFADGSKVPDTQVKYLQSWLFNKEADVSSFFLLGALWKAKFVELQTCSNRTEITCTKKADGKLECSVIRKCD